MHKRLLSIVTCVLLLSGCTSLTPEQQSTLEVLNDNIVESLNSYFGSIAHYPARRVTVYDTSGNEIDNFVHVRDTNQVDYQIYPSGDIITTAFPLITEELVSTEFKNIVTFGNGDYYHFVGTLNDGSRIGIMCDNLLACVYGITGSDTTLYYYVSGIVQSEADSFYEEVLTYYPDANFEVQNDVSENPLGIHSYDDMVEYLTNQFGDDVTLVSDLPGSSSICTGFKSALKYANSNSAFHFESDWVADRYILECMDGIYIMYVDGDMPINLEFKDYTGELLDDFSLQDFSNSSVSVW